MQNHQKLAGNKLYGVINQSPYLFKWQLHIYFSTPIICELLNVLCWGKKRDLFLSFKIEWIWLVELGKILSKWALSIKQNPHTNSGDCYNTLISLCSLPPTISFIHMNSCENHSLRQHHLPRYSDSFIKSHRSIHFGWIIIHIWKL